MGLFDGIVDKVGSGIGDFAVSSILGGLTSGELNKSAVKANLDTERLKDLNQKRALASLQETGDFGAIRQDEATGGFTSTQPGGPSAAQARSRLAFGDTERALGLNEASRNFAFQLPTRAGAQGIVDRDNRGRVRELEKGMGDIASLKQRQFGGLQNTGGEANTTDAIGRFIASNELNREQQGLDLFNKQRESDLSILAQQIAANQPQVPAPGFTTGGPGATAAAAISQTPPPARVADISGAIPFATGGNFMKQLYDQQNQKRRDDQYALLVRTLGNQRA
jgi:hypothetical protein